MHVEIDWIRKGTVAVCFKALPQSSPGRTVETHEKPENSRVLWLKKKKKLNTVACSPKANYT
jgi:hypothetical protein